MSPKHNSKLDHALKQIGTRAVKVVEKAAAGGPWTTDAILRAADWLEHGSKEGGVQRPWPNLAARLRNLVAAEATTSATETPPIDEGADTTPTVATQRTTKAKTKKATPMPAKAPTTPPVARDGLPFSDFAERYLKHLEATGKSRGTVFSYSLDLNVAARHFGEDRDVATITRNEVAAYYASDAVQKSRGGGAKNAITIAKLQRTLRLALVWAAATGLIAEAPIPVAAKATTDDDEVGPTAPKARRGRKPKVASGAPHVLTAT